MGADESKLVGNVTARPARENSERLNEIEITPEMEWAGWEILFGFRIDKHPLKKTVRKIYTAMALAKQRPKHQEQAEQTQSL